MKMHADYIEIFPGKLAWPKAVSDVGEVEPAVEVLRLVSKVKGIEKLPGFSRLKKLWCFDVNPDFFQLVCQCRSLQELYIDGFKGSDVRGLQKLESLSVLLIDSCAKLKDLAGFSNFKSLRGLGIANFKNVHDLDPLAGLNNLESLSVAGGMESSAGMEVKTFKPLSNLRNLRFLHLTNIKALDKSLKPLENLDKLVQLDLANFYPMEEFARLSGRLRNTRCLWFKPLVEVNFKKCKKCGKMGGAMLSGGGTTVLCTDCDAKKLAKHAEDFKRIARESSVH